ncbi:MAG TPA: S1C family serine protease, partial [Draconibacterium sp.]|nr:S1C family serine protease [Draconibacterium sp.]
MKDNKAAKIITRLRVTAVITLFVFVLFGCQTKEKQQEDKKPGAQKTEAENKNTGWENIRASIVKIDSYDDNRILESGQGFFVADNLIATKYSLINQANKVVVTPLDSRKKYTLDKFVAVDRINDLIILQIDSLHRKPIELFKGTVPNSAKSMYLSASPGKTIQLFSGKVVTLETVKGTKLYRVTNRVRKSTFGMPIFVSNKKAFGIAFSAVESFEMRSFAIPSTYISELLAKRKTKAETLESLRSISNAKVAAENRKIKGLVLETDMGDITIRL